jgi:2-amino-4-hydroxy-6-hydroxymethyldihydropteridine diphosphokinase
MNAITTSDRAAVLCRAIFLEQVSIVWMLAEGVIALASGVAARSLALVAFGWDSLIELVTAAAVLWRLVAETRGADLGEARPRAEGAERVAARIVAVSLLVLALYIVVEAVVAVRERRIAGPGWGGVVASAAALVGMPVLFRAKRRVADALDSGAMREDAFGNLACAGMGAITLASLAVQRAGLWWADPAAALLLGAWVAREGLEAWERAGEHTGRAATPVRAYLGLGSNLGNRAEALAGARAMLEASDLRIVAASRVYESAPWGVVEQPPFLNQVVEVETTLTPRELLQRCHEIEGRLGRERSTRWGPRTIDVDILLYGTVRTSEPDLIIPHPQLPRRAFVLVPLAELNAGLRVRGGETIQDLLDALPDKGGVTVYKGEPHAGSDSASVAGVRPAVSEDR